MSAGDIPNRRNMNQPQQEPPPFVKRAFGMLGIKSMKDFQQYELLRLLTVIGNILKESKENSKNVDYEVIHFCLQMAMRTKRPKLEEIVKGVEKIIEMSVIYAAEVRKSYGVFMLTAGSFIEAVGVLNFPLSEEMCKSYIQSLVEYITKSEMTEDFIKTCDCLPPCSQIFFTRFPNLIQLLQNNDELIRSLNQIRYHTGGTKMLHMLVEALFDEKYVILDMDSKNGFEVVQSGCTDNVQFSALLANELIPKHLKDGARTSEVTRKCLEGEIPPQTLPNERIVGNWDMYNWVGIQADGSLKNDHDLWIWCEGTPSDVSRFDLNEEEEEEEDSESSNDFKNRGVRVVVITKPLYQRYHGVTRVFTHLKASVKVTKVMEEEEFNGWMKRIREAGEKKRERANSFVASRIVSVGNNDDEEEGKKNGK